MTEKEIVRAIMQTRGWSQQKLAEEAGFKSQSNVTGLLNRGNKGMRTDQLFRLLDALGCELVVRDKMDNKNEWVIKHPIVSSNITTVVLDKEDPKSDYIDE